MYVFRRTGGIALFFTTSLSLWAQTPSWVKPLLGPTVPIHTHPFKYFDEMNTQAASFLGGLQSTDYLDWWNTPNEGTISVALGATAVVGVGTHFLADFCNGAPGAGYNGAGIVIWYPVPKSASTGRRAPGVASCQSDTQLTLTVPWAVYAGVANVQYSAGNNQSFGIWVNGSNNANYYCNVCGFYSLHFRTPEDTANLNYARTLADRWWTMPFIDQGRACSDGIGTYCLAPRMLAVKGLIARALDGRPDMWPGIRAMVNWKSTLVTGSPKGKILFDVREEGYVTSDIADMAQFDPDPGQRSAWLKMLRSVMANHWETSQWPDGSFRNMTFGECTWNGSPGLVSVTNGSATVIGAGTNWQAASFAGNNFWTANPDGVTNGDAVAYTATVVSPTQITLNMPYQGPTASGRGWQVGSLVGIGTQPFMLGIAGEAFRQAYQALDDSKIVNMLSGMVAWLQNVGYRPDSRGLWYGRIFPNCEPISAANTACSGGDAEASRFLLGEIEQAVSAAYAFAPNASLKAWGDNIVSAQWAKYSTDIGYDGIYVNDLDGPSSWGEQQKLAKDFGFCCGIGNGGAWPAVADTGPLTRIPPGRRQ